MAADVDAEKARLPRPIMTFSSPNKYMDFALTGRNKDQIVAANRADVFRTKEEGSVVERAVLYDDSSHSVITLPGLTFPQCNLMPMSPVAVGDDQYFMGVEKVDRRVQDDNDVYSYDDYDDGMSPDHRILVRRLTRQLGRYHQYPDWYWYSFPPPPYSHHAGEMRNHHSDENEDEVAAYAVVGQVGGWHIWASMRGHGTYSMSTENGEWSKISDSALPFGGPAVYAPEHGLWFGFPDEDRYYHKGLLGAWGLHAGADAPVVASGAWEGFAFPEPYDCLDLRSDLVHLGDGRFCVARLLRMWKPPRASFCSRCYYDSNPPEIGFALLTGVEVERCDSGELRMIKHRSCKGWA